MRLKNLVKFDSDAFYQEYIAATGPGKLKAVGKLCQLIGLQPGHDTSVRICKVYKPSWAPERLEHTIEFEIDMTQLTADRRRKLKAFVTLEVPSYALGGTYKSPPLQGAVTLGEHSKQPVLLDFTVNGAYICKPRGKVEQPPSEWELRQAEKLQAMTPEEILAAHQKKIADMTSPREVDSYECAPVAAPEGN